MQEFPVCSFNFEGNLHVQFFFPHFFMIMNDIWEYSVMCLVLTNDLQ